MQTNKKTLRGLARSLPLAAVLLAPTLGLAFNTTYQMCTTEANHTWYPTIDGEMDTDAGWINAYAYRADPIEAGPADVEIWSNAQAGSPTRLNFGFKVDTDASYDDTDTLVMAFANGSNYHRIHVKPLHNSGVGVQGSCPAGAVIPRMVEYWTGTPGGGGTINWSSATTFTDALPSWMRACTRNSGASTPKKWATEVQIDIGGGPALPIPTNTDLGVYLNVYRAATDSGGVQTQSQFTWPAANGLIFDAIENTPTPDTWGVGRILAANNTACKGLFLVPVGGGWAGNPGYGANIGTGHPGIISTTSPNLFSATVYNDGPQANRVRASFHYYPWGSTNQWTPVPNGIVPPSPGATVLANTPNTTDFRTTTGWTASPADAGHACVRVDLSSDVGGTVFKQRSAFNNFTIMPGSRVEMKATIDPAIRGGGAARIWVQPSTAVDYAYALGSIAALKRGTLTEQLTTTFRPYLLTDRFVVNEGKKQYFMQRLPQYGVIVQHAMPRTAQLKFEKLHAELLKPEFLLDPLWSQVQAAPVAAIDTQFFSATRKRATVQLRTVPRTRLLATARSPLTEWAVAVPKTLPKVDLKQNEIQRLVNANTVLVGSREKPSAKVWDIQLPGQDARAVNQGFWLEAGSNQYLSVPLVVEHP